MLYDIAFLIFSVFYLPALIFKGKLHKDFVERFGVYSALKRSSIKAGRDVIWVQAVSVGEVALCASLVPALRERFPASSIVFSTITATGNELARKLFSKYATVIYFPLDLSFVVRKAVNLIRPKIYIMIETEIWPNLLKELSGRGVPSILINGRISDRSFGKYKLARPFLKNTYGRINLFCMQSDLDAERITEMGAPPERVRVTGNMKFDVDISFDQAKTDEMKALIGLRPGQKLLVAGSVHVGEVVPVLEAFAALSKEFPELKLILAQRHVENFPYAESAAKEIGGKCGFKHMMSSARPGPVMTGDGAVSAESAKVIIVDKMGYLRDLYALATLVFVGGSLVKHGGQNPLEPAILEKAVIFGPHMFNFKDIARRLLSANAAVQVEDQRRLAAEIRSLLEDAQKRLSLGRNARKVVLDNRGATARNIEAIGGLLAR